MSGRRNLVVGVTIFPPKTGYSVWSNGAHANVYFLWKLLRHCENVLEVVLINGGDGEPPDDASLPDEVRGAQFARMADCVDRLDVLIQAGAQVAAEDVATVRARGGRAISYKFGNDHALSAEAAIHNTPHSAIFNGAVFDRIVTTSQHAATCGAYWETTYRAPVRVVPHIWSPWFVDAMVASLRGAGVEPTYEARMPHAAARRVLIAEPCINWVKTCHVPMLAVENAWRARPDLIDRVLVTNSLHMRGRQVFETFVGTLDCAKAKAGDGLPVMSFESRYNLPWLCSQSEAIVSHQWLPSPNYLCYDALHLGTPLVHNVPELAAAGCGYYYDGWDCIEGGRALVRAMAEHDAGRDAYEARSRAFLETRSATSAANVAAHAAMLDEAFS